MRPSMFTAAILGLTLTATASISAQKAKGPKLTTVTGVSTFACTDAEPRSEIPGDGVCGDAWGPFYDGEEDIESDLRDGDREFRVQSMGLVPTVRSFVIRFPTSAAPAQAFECTGDACRSAGRVLDRVYAVAGLLESDPNGRQITGVNTNLVTAGNVEVTGGLTSIPIGGTHRSRILVGFPDPDGRPYRWALYFNPAAYPGAGLATITRTAACTWTITTGPTDLAGLILFGGEGRGRTVATSEGRYSMPLNITFTATATTCN